MPGNRKKTLKSIAHMALTRFSLALLLALSPALVMASIPTVQDASLAFRQGNKTVALNKVNAFLAANPKDAQARFLKGLILTDMNRHPEAIKVFSDLTDDYPELPEPYNNLAVLYAAQADYERAKQSLEMAIRTHPSYATAHENLGDIYAKMASRAYDKALQLDQGNVSALTKLALIKDLFSPAARGQDAAPKGAGKEGAATKQPQLAQEASVPVEPPRPQKATAAADVKSEAPPVAAAVAAAAGDTTVTKPGANPKAEIEKTVRAWAEAWSARDADAYLAFYGEGFKPPGNDRAAWENQRRERVTRPEYIKVAVEQLRVRMSGDELARASFRQRYESNLLRSSGSKTLTLAWEGDAWKIVDER